MLSHVATRRVQCRQSINVVVRATAVQYRGFHHDNRDRLSFFWAPTQRQVNQPHGTENSFDLLARAGFLRQAHAGLFHLLPLGLRVQNKVERLIDKYMAGIGASKVSLSSISSEQLWLRSGRLDKGRESEFLRFKDRKGAKYLLSPTHEEEITSIVANSVHSYKDLPLRLYQVTRKYRDEPRPRQGLLRAREFVMKDLYTFDVSDQAASRTYEEVRNAYNAFFKELGLPYLVALADSGNMGGNLSHEFHFASPHGEDTVISCDSCHYVANEEKFLGDPTNSPPPATGKISDASFATKDGATLVKVFWPGDSDDLNIYAVKRQFPGLDTGRRIGDAGQSTVDGETQSRQPKEGIILLDPRLSEDQITTEKNSTGATEATWSTRRASVDGQSVLLSRAKPQDSCPACQTGRLVLQQTIEIGHTFHLGTRYSIPLEAQVLDAQNEKVSVSMGCHGIGVSRIIGAVSSLLADKKGLNWPYSIAPFTVVIVPGVDASKNDVDRVYDDLAKDKALVGLDAVIDDRDKPMGWKLNDADLIGYPFIVVLGKAWKERTEVELQCRRLGVKETLSPSELGQRIRKYVQQL